MQIDQIKESKNYFRLAKYLNSFELETLQYDGGSLDNASMERFMFIFYAEWNNESMEVRTNLLLHQYIFIQKKIKLIFLDIEKDNDCNYFIENKELAISPSTLPYILWCTSLNWKGDFVNQNHLTKYLRNDDDMFFKLAIGHSLKNVIEINSLFDFLSIHDEFPQDENLQKLFKGKVVLNISNLKSLKQVISSHTRKTTIPSTSLLSPTETVSISDRPLYLFVAGDRSKVGKSSVCLGLLGSLLRHGFTPSDLAYIKPATQCEQPQLITKYCNFYGIANRGLGPVIFYKGFTREFLKGNVGSSDDLLNHIQHSVEEIGRNKKLVIIDGVGYPGVGSICGISNADIAKKLKAPVLIVGKHGVGDAIDSYNLNSTFFKYYGLFVIGSIFNRFPIDGFYSLVNCKEAIDGYFDQYKKDSNEAVFGYLPELEELVHMREEIEKESLLTMKEEQQQEQGKKRNGLHLDSQMTEDEILDKHNNNKEGICYRMNFVHSDSETKRILLANKWIDVFCNYINTDKLFRTLLKLYSTEIHQIRNVQNVSSGVKIADDNMLLDSTEEYIPLQDTSVNNLSIHRRIETKKLKTRAEIEIEAQLKGAKLGG